MNDRSEIDIAEFLTNDWLPWELSIRERPAVMKACGVGMM